MTGIRIGDYVINETTRAPYPSGLVISVGKIFGAPAAFCLLPFGVIRPWYCHQLRKLV